MKEKRDSAADVTRVGIRWIALLGCFFGFRRDIAQDFETWQITMEKARSENVSRLLKFRSQTDKEL